MSLRVKLDLLLQSNSVKYCQLCRHIAYWFCFRCSTCQLGFINQRDFNRHNRRHAKNYSCEVSDCGKNFECYTHLLRHTTLHHPTGRCRTQFECYPLLPSHTALYHPTCEWGKQFECFIQSLRHTTLHHPAGHSLCCLQQVSLCDANLVRNDFVGSFCV